MITPEDVANTNFTNVGFFHTHGYHETEVDDFLDEVEAELKRRDRELEEVKRELNALKSVDPSLQERLAADIAAAPGGNALMLAGQLAEKGWSKARFWAPGDEREFDYSMVLEESEPTGLGWPENQHS